MDEEIARGNYSMKIAVCGCAGIGKSTLVAALAERLAITPLGEHYEALFSPPGTFNTEPVRLIQLFNQVLDDKHRLQDEATDFVVDRAGIDLLNLWMARGLASYGDATREFADRCQDYVKRYDLIVFPPWGVLPLVPHDGGDGRVRVQDPWIQLRNHAAILGLARLWGREEKILCLPDERADVESWVDQVCTVLERQSD